MKNTILLLFTVLSPILGHAQEKIQWMTIEEAYALTTTEESPKKIFIDVYTDWCGWCKRMDKATFQRPEVATYMNEHFYNVKFNAEQKEDIEMLGNTFKFIAQGNRGYRWVSLADKPEMIFDHNEIHDMAYERLKRRVKGRPIGFVLLAKQFTFNNIHTLYEECLGK